MRSSSRVLNAQFVAAVAALALLALGGPSSSSAGPSDKTAARTAAGPVLPDRYTAKTTNVTPSDIGLRFDVRTWSDDEGRAAVVAALGETDPAKALMALPTLGYVWVSNASVGASIKYAKREPANGGERVTFVTDRELGWQEFKPWAPKPPATAKDLPYSVIELYLDGEGKGTGSFSLAADVKVDEATASVSLADGAPQLLVDAKLEPKPYWARGGADGN